MLILHPVKSTCTVEEVLVHLIVGVTQGEKKLELQKLVTVELQ